MKGAAEGKHKLYVAVVYTETVITPEVIKKLEEYHDLAIKQKTPVRVLHRRSLLTRDKMIYVCVVGMLLLLGNENRVCESSSLYS